jgi:hypothetical protein
MVVVGDVSRACLQYDGPTMGYIVNTGFSLALIPFNDLVSLLLLRLARCRLAKRAAFVPSFGRLYGYVSPTTWKYEAE